MLRRVSVLKRPKRAANPNMAASIKRPPLSQLGREPWRAAFEFFSHIITRDPVASGDGHPVIIFPGLGGDGHSVVPLRKHCEKLGYTALDWGSDSTPARRETQTTGWMSSKGIPKTC
jgi:hypothetical protein